LIVDQVKGDIDQMNLRNALQPIPLVVFIALLIAVIHGFVSGHFQGRPFEELFWILRFAALPVAVLFGGTILYAIFRKKTGPRKPLKFSVI